MIDELIKISDQAEQAPNIEMSWKAARLMALYRLLLSFIIVLGYLYQPVGSLLGHDNSAVFFAVAIAYLVFGLYVVIANHLRWPSLKPQIYLHCIIDIIAIMVFMHTSGGLSSGIGVLFIVIVASIGALTQLRTAMVFAAATSLLVLGEHAYRVLGHGAAPSYFVQAGTLGATLFISALVFSVLAQRLRESERLAEKIGVDLENMGQLNDFIIQRMGAGVLVVDEKMHIRLMNEAARYLLGLSAKKGLPSLELISKPLADQLIRWFQDSNYDSTVFRVTGSVAIYPRFTRLGKEIYAGALIMLEDTSILDQQAQHMKMTALGRLTASVAHEIRNPLGAISHAGQLLEESANLDRADKRLTQIIREQSVRMNTIVENVMQLSRRDKSLPETIKLDCWLNDFLEEFARTHDVDPKKLGLDVSPPDVEIIFDPSHLHQILSNLCQNGIRHGGEHSGVNLLEIQAGKSRDVQGAFLDVIDCGPGIDAEMASQIFEPFFTTATKGTGLGLYIARELAEANQAHLDYVPIPTGGTCFRITFANNF
ncbi:MAG: ATP-binding protein [Gammaproteobacteria bacterium]|nr:ATP-binding protein [Gammaproteobacteria bacterium]